MPTADEYRQCALELCSKARNEPSRDLKLEFEKLAVAYMQLAEMAESTTLVDPTVKLAG